VKPSHLAAALSVGLAALALGAGVRAPAQAGPNWLTDVSQARAAARREGKPLFAMFR